MSWRVAKSLDVLLAQINAYAPNRSKVSDGSIGDAAHASRSSDHNPWYGPGIVTARDYTHDPVHGMNCQFLADQLTTSGDKRIKYVIWNHRIWEHGWTAYNGANPHDHHLHLSVVASPACDDTSLWRLPMFGGASSAPPPKPPIVVPVGSVNVDIAALQAFGNKAFPAYCRLVVDGVNGPKTTAFIKEFQRRSNLRADGVLGTLTIDALRRYGFKG